MEATPSTNPLRLLAVLAIVFLVMDALRLYSHHTLNFVGITRVILNTAFLLLYARRSPFAWHVAVVVGPAILLVYLFLYFTGGDIYRPRHHAREVMIIWAIGEVIVLAAFFIYLFRLRQPYLRYVSHVDASTI
jgi:hypothetical protein